MNPGKPSQRLNLRFQRQELFLGTALFNNVVDLMMGKQNALNATRSRAVWPQTAPDAAYSRYDNFASEARFPASLPTRQWRTISYALCCNEKLRTRTPGPQEVYTWRNILCRPLTGMPTVEVLDISRLYLVKRIRYRDPLKAALTSLVKEY